MPLITKPSQLNERVTLINSTYESDNIGNQIATYHKILTCWAQVRTDFMNSEFVARQHAFPDSIEVVIRYNQAADVTKALYLYWNGKILDIDRINVDTAYKQYTVIVATEKIGSQGILNKLDGLN